MHSQKVSKDIFLAQGFAPGLERQIDVVDQIIRSDRFQIGGNFQTVEFSCAMFLFQLRKCPLSLAQPLVAQNVEWRRPFPLPSKRAVVT